MGKTKFCNLFSNVDPLAAQAISQVDEKTYRADWQPDTTFAIWAIRRLPRLVSRMLRARMWPDRCHEEAQAEMVRYIHDARLLAEQDLAVPEFAERLLGRTANLIFNYVVPLFAASRIVLERLKKVAGEEREQLVKRLEHSLPHNPTVEMGMALYDLSQLLPERLSVDELTDGIKERRLPDRCLTTWNSFLDKYGHRCAGELDIASPRYRENPRMLLEQLATLRASSTANDNPRVRYERNLADRLAAYQEVCDELSSDDPRRLRRFKLLYHVWETLGGCR